MIMTATELAFLGLGRMGAHMVARMLETKKIRVVAWKRSPDKVRDAETLGAVGALNIADAVSKLAKTPRVVWMMLPSGDVTESAFRELLSLLKKGDVIIDGANSNFHDSIRRHKEAKDKGISMLDVGVTGGGVA